MEETANRCKLIVLTYRVSPVLDMWQAEHKNLCPAWMPHTCSTSVGQLSVKAPCHMSCWSVQITMMISFAQTLTLSEWQPQSRVLNKCVSTDTRSLNNCRQSPARLAELFDLWGLIDISTVLDLFSCICMKVYCSWYRKKTCIRDEIERMLYSGISFFCSKLCLKNYRLLLVESTSNFAWSLFWRKFTSRVIYFCQILSASKIFVNLLFIWAGLDVFPFKMMRKKACHRVQRVKISRNWSSSFVGR